MSGNPPYIVYLSSDAGQDLFKRIQRDYPADQIVSFCAPDFGSPSSTKLSMASIFDQSLLDVAEQVSEAAALHNLQPVLAEINERGYPPVAVISCPFFAQALLVHSVEGVAPICPVMRKFKGTVALMCTTSEAVYRAGIPALFDLQHFFTCHEMGRDWADTKQFLIEQIEKAGIQRLPQAVSGIPREPQSRAFVPQTPPSRERATPQ